MGKTREKSTPTPLSKSAEYVEELSEDSERPPEQALPGPRETSSDVTSLELNKAHILMTGNGRSGTTSSDNERPCIANPQSPAKALALSSYDPPAGFEIASIETDFDNAMMDGKIIWHIAVPKDVPLQELHSIPRSSLQDSTAHIKIADASYSLLADTKLTNTHLLLPQAEKNAYCPHISSISRSLYLYRQVALATTTGSTSVPVQRNRQPDGLKMRPHAFGIVGAAHEPPAPRPQFHTHKRKHAASAEKSKSKKARQHHSLETDGTENRHQAKLVQPFKVPTSLATDPPSPQSTESPTSREQRKLAKAQRKAERHRRREAHASQTGD